MSSSPPLHRRRQVGPSEPVRLTTLDAIPAGAIHVAPDGAVVDANAEACRIFGYEIDDPPRLWRCALVLREDGTPCPPSEHPVTAALATGETQGPTTFGVRNPNGETYWAVFRAVPTRDPAGQISGALVTFVDITERKRVEEDLRRSEAKWRSLAEGLPDFIVMVDRRARILSVNRTLPRLPQDQVIGTYAHTYVQEDYRPEWEAAFASVLESGAPARLESCGEGASGPSWYEIAFIPLRDGESVDRVLIVARDITERRMMIARLAERERLASVGMLSASVAHEVMNPLTSVLANLDFALGDRCPPGARMTKALLDARDDAARLQQIVWDLRTLGRTGTDEFFYVDVRSVIETALRLAGPEVARNVEVTVDLGEVPDVLASESRLCQVFINLLVNAAQAMADRPVRAVTIRTKTDEGAGLVGVAISDTGSGIEAENLGRIFDPFFTTKKSGSGLGLSISRECLERMGGRIEVDSRPGMGTTFTVWLSTTRLPTQSHLAPQSA